MTGRKSGQEEGSTDGLASGGGEPDFVVLCLAAAVVLFAFIMTALLAFSPSRQASMACPADAQAAFGKSYSELRQDCLGAGVAHHVLSCGNLRTLALRVDDVSWPEGKVAAAAFKAECGLIGDGDAPVPAVARSEVPDGKWSGVREFASTAPSCGGVVPVDAFVHDGKMTFQTAGRTWVGFVAPNMWIAVNSDGVSPSVPAGAVIGPVTLARIFDGHCGEGVVSFQLPE